MDQIASILSESGLENSKANRDRVISLAEQLLSEEGTERGEAQRELRRWGDDASNVKRSRIINILSNEKLA